MQTKRKYALYRWIEIGAWVDARTRVSHEWKSTAGRRLRHLRRRPTVVYTNIGNGRISSRVEISIVPTHTHTHIRANINTHTQKAEKDISVYGYTSMRRRGRVFSVGWVAFLLTICIYWAVGRGEGGEREGENEQGPSRDSQWKFPFRGDRCRGRLFSARRRRSDARRSIF